MKSAKNTSAHRPVSLARSLAAALVLAATSGAAQELPDRARMPRLRLEPPTINGNMTSRQVVPVLRRTLPRARRCYELVLRVQPDMQGSITIEMTVGPNGSVLGTQVRASIPALARVAECVIEEALQWQFPRGAESRGSVTITQEYELRPPL